MMTETQQFLEQLKDPFRFSLRKVCFDFHNDPRYNSLIYDLRIQQVNGLDFYHIPLITRDLHQQITLVSEFADMLEEYVPNNIHTSYSKSDELPTGMHQRIFYAWDDATVQPFS